MQPGRGTGRSPRNLIFASLGKPDIRFTSALDNDIEIAERADKVLVYDTPVGNDGLLWRDLLSWWQATQASPTRRGGPGSVRADEESLPRDPQDSAPVLAVPPSVQGQLDEVPALLPEIWMHWDHKTVRERGENALQNLRMDFLMLLPGDRRVVLEVDGSQHFTREAGPYRTAGSTP